MTSAESPTRRLLILAYNFPPQISGVRRTLKFIKYLAPLGWRISALTVKPVRSERYDNAPLEEIRGLCRVYRSGSLDPYRIHQIISDLGFRISDLTAKETKSFDGKSDTFAPGMRDKDSNRNQTETPNPKSQIQNPKSEMVAAEDSASHIHGKSEVSNPKSEIKNPKSEVAGRARASDTVRAIMRFLRHWIFIVDDRAGWLPFALMKALRIVRHERPDWILTTSLPNTSHLIGLALKALHPRLRWVADFRDGWTLSAHYYAPPTRLHRWVNERLERAVARRCDLLVTVSPPLTDYFRAMPGVEAAKCHTITNGYDPEDFEAVLGEPRDYGENIFTLVYTGSFFGTRSPEGLLKGLAQFLAEKPEAVGEFRADFYTQWDDEWRRRARELGLGTMVNVQDFLPYRQCLARQAAAAALLLLVPAEPHEPIMMTQKVFEYLAARRPILCLAPEGVAVRALLGETGGAVLAHPDDAGAIARALGELWEAWRADEIRRYEPRDVERFARPALARQLHDLMTATDSSR